MMFEDGIMMVSDEDILDMRELEDDDGEDRGEEVHQSEL